MEVTSKYQLALVGAGVFLIYREGKGNLCFLTAGPDGNEVTIIRRGTYDLIGKRGIEIEQRRGNTQTSVRATGPGWVIGEKEDD